MKKISIFFIPLLFFIPLFMVVNMTREFSAPPKQLPPLSDLRDQIGEIDSLSNTEVTQNSAQNKTIAAMIDDNSQELKVIDHPENATSQIKILEMNLYQAEFKYEQLTDEISTLSLQKETLMVESQTYLTDLQTNYLQKLTQIKNEIAKQPISETHPQIKTNGMKSVEAMIQMITVYIENPNQTDYITLGETAINYIQEAFTNIDLDNTLSIVKYLTSAGSGQTAIGLKLKDAQSIANKFMVEYGNIDSTKGGPYRQNKKQQEATVNVIEIQQQEIDTISLEISGIKQQLEEIIQ